MTQTREWKLPFEVWALVAGGFTIALGYGVLAPVLPQFALEFGVSNFAASGIISAFALMRLIFAPVAGLIVTRLGERTTYVLGLLIVAVTTGISAFVISYEQLLIFRSLAGIGSTMFTIAATALLIKVSPPSKRGRVSGINSAGFLLGNLIGPVLGAFVAGLGLRAPFILYFITLVIAAIVVWVALRKSTLAVVGDAAGLPAPRSLKEALRFSQYRGALASTFAFGWAAFGVRVSVVPLFIAATIGTSDSDAGWVLAAYAAGNALFVIPSGRWNDKIGRKPLLVVGLLMSAVAFFVLPLTTALWAAMAILAVAGVGSAFVNPAQQATVADVVGRRGGGPVVAAVQMTADLGAILGPVIAGLLADHVGFGSAFAITGVMLLISGVIWMFIPDSRRLIEGEFTAPIGVVPASEPNPTFTGPIPIAPNTSESDSDRDYEGEGEPRR